MTSSHASSEHPSESAAGAQPPLRASDADRAATVKVLQQAVAHGLLTYGEADERIAAAFAARYRHDLSPLTADLPTASPRSAPGWRQLGGLLTEQVRHEVRATIAAGPRSRRFLVAVLLVVAVGLLLTLATLDLEEFWEGGHEHHVELGTSVQD